MNFKKNKYEIIKKAINKDVADISYKYLLLKRDVTKLFFDTKYISPYEEMFGTWSDKQIPNTYSIYGDILMEVLLKEIKTIMEKITNLKLIETYAYARVYKKGDVLKKHIDRFSCEISTTLNLGGDPWPIFINGRYGQIILFFSIAK
jgi:tRNA G37 N-methylase Trm5